MQQQSHKRKLILASSSPYRKLLLERLRIPFEVLSPSVDETPAENETAAHLVVRLAGDKARAVARQFPQAVVIGSDQIAVCGGKIIGKPGSAANAARQLRQFSGRTIQFLTAVCVVCAGDGFDKSFTIGTDVTFRDLSDDEILRYIEMDQPFDCAGSFKSESGGISLMRAMHSDDPTAIVGLPLITLAAALREAGYRVP